MPHRFDTTLPEALRAAVDHTLVPMAGVPGLRVDPTLVAQHPDLHDPAMWSTVAAIARQVGPSFERVMRQRERDRAFIDEHTAAAATANADVPYANASYRTVLGATDALGRVVVGPLSAREPKPVALPERLRGATVTLFGPPDNERMCAHAMNAWHRRRRDESPLVGELLERNGAVPFWGADSEDSKTPMIGDLLSAIRNLRACVERTLEAKDPKGGPPLRLASDHLSVPIKRVPGLALPDALHQLDGQPLPLHLVDLVLHAQFAGGRAEALTFYVPKLENEEEAAYLAELVDATERAIGVPRGTIRLFVVFETPRAIFRIREMADALHPWFAGGSLGWHDFLAATARMFKNDPRYRIPVKADPDIVVRHIKESHLSLVRALRPAGAVCIGGMYGTLFEEGNDASFRVSMIGYVRDVVTQLKRGLDGFWVAHPDFVRIGIALVEAWRRREAGDAEVMPALLAALVPDPRELAPLLAFVDGPDVPGLEPADPLYLRRVLAADIDASRGVSNHEPHEVRYNLFQAIQYLTAWLDGTGCVALPAAMRGVDGESVFVRIMDDLATTERSRWELWHEVHHGRVSVDALDVALAEQVDALRGVGDRRVQVPFHPRWTPIAAKILRQLVSDPTPPESVSELLVPFTLAPVRDAADPWEAARAFGVPLC
jgi:malate synthase